MKLTLKARSLLALVAIPVGALLAHAALAADAVSNAAVSHQQKHLVYVETRPVINYHQVTVESPLRVSAVADDGCRYSISLVPVRQAHVDKFLNLVGRVESNTCPQAGSEEAIVTATAERDTEGKMVVDKTITVYPIWHSQTKS
ncbi:hypothetical protein [Burkholderia gladioli]|uniref:hypothetical protein n=1 Tax=Burkholderia gladioli TaxID=28095 RepID=UPI0016401E53|nr:hypothetical protein [Burkholderia gladioli]